MIANLNWPGVIILAKNSFVRSFDVELNFMTDYRLLFSIDLKKKPGIKVRKHLCEYEFG